MPPVQTAGEAPHASANAISGIEVLLKGAQTGAARGCAGAGPQGEPANSVRFLQVNCASAHGRLRGACSTSPRV
jgi:hypothetical protein